MEGVAKTQFKRTRMHHGMKGCGHPWKQPVRVCVCVLVKASAKGPRYMLPDDGVAGEAEVKLFCPSGSPQTHEL